MIPSNSFHRFILCAAFVAAAGLAGASTAAPRHGGNLNWIVTPEPASIVPLVKPTGGSQDIGPKIVEGLLTFDYNLDPKPLLATSWSVSKDGLQYRFDLRKGVKWHDGKDFTSADVAFSILAIKQYQPRGRVTFANVTGVTTPDAHTAVIELSKPAPYLLTALAATESPILPKHLYDGTDIFTNKYNDAPVGTGPFVFKEWVKGSHVTLDRNPDYWDKPKPYLDKLTIHFIPDAAARALAFESGSADLGQQSIPLSDVERFKAMPNFTVTTVKEAYLCNQQQLFFNFESPILKDIRVRRALAGALDLKAFNKLVWFGYGEVYGAVISPLIAKYHDDGIPLYAYDPKQSEADLDAAGYKRGPDGTRFRLRLLWNPYMEKRAPEFVRQSFAKIGVDAMIENYDQATYNIKTFTDRAFDIALESMANTFDPTVGVQRGYWSKSFKIGLSSSNPSHYSNPEVDGLLEAAAVEIDGEKRRQLFKDFQRFVNKDVVSVILGTFPRIVVAAKKVKDYAPTAEALRGSFADVYLEE
jgi:peptide/nickel transport system substrate-binding protein